MAEVQKKKWNKWPEIKVRCNFLKTENFSIFGKIVSFVDTKAVGGRRFIPNDCQRPWAKGRNVTGEHKSREQPRSGYTNTASGIYLRRSLTKPLLQLPITVRHHPQTYCAVIFTPVAVFLAAFVSKTRQANGWFCFKLAKSRSNCKHKQYWIPNQTFKLVSAAY